ncbi:MAG: tRNA (adenosine(37)-N6)-threonylcarbamoyltransferase complex dimerization subunit type 1 TsaB [Candidatus Omnitrophica bacterium]|nr:tRNA (adenosine(37)-N6)-threonylcarbamoyltransferase complex dimerization subunit type 1 TsaB [Candidatus Omnitrophota bacterium]
MKLVALDTSTETLCLGISDDKKVLLEEKMLLERKHSTQLLPILRDALKRLGLSIKEMDGFIVGLGPGSFTGLRVGISMVKAMALSLEKPIVGVPTLDCLAEAVSVNGIQIAPLMDAKREQVYAALYERRNDLLQKKIEEKVIPPESFLKEITAKTLFLGGGASLYRDKIVKFLKEKASFADPTYDIPDPRTLLSLGRARFEKKKFENLNHLVPLYLYPKDCMIRKG